MGVRRIYQYEPYRVDLCAACISSNFKASTHMQELTKTIVHGLMIVEYDLQVSLKLPVHTESGVIHHS